MMKKQLIFFAAALFSVGCNQPHNSGAGPETKAKVEVIDSAQAVQSRMDAGGVVVVHALNKEHYEKGHIPGAVNVDYQTMKADMLPPDKATPLIFYCASPSCPVGHMAADKAASFGYTHVAVYKGGIEGWKAAGMPVDTGANP